MSRKIKVKRNVRVNGKRTSRTVVYKSLTAASKAAGIPYMTLYMRLREGWTANAALTAPVREYEKTAA